MSIAIAVLTLLFGGLSLWAARYVHRQMRETRDWPTVPGKILERGVGEPMGLDRSYMPHVKYTYFVGGKQYTNDQVYLIRRTGGLASQIQKLVDSLPDPVTVYYDPKDPVRSFLIVNPKGTFWLLLIFGLVVVTVGLLQVFVIVLGPES